MGTLKRYIKDALLGSSLWVRLDSQRGLLAAGANLWVEITLIFQGLSRCQDSCSCTAPNQNGSWAPPREDPNPMSALKTAPILSPWKTFFFSPVSHLRGLYLPPIPEAGGLYILPIFHPPLSLTKSLQL